MNVFFPRLDHPSKLRFFVFLLCEKRLLDKNTSYSKRGFRAKSHA